MLPILHSKCLPIKSFLDCRRLLRLDTTLHCVLYPTFLGVYLLSCLPLLARPAQKELDAPALYREICATIEAHFYSRAYNPAAWKRAKQKYAPMAERATNQHEFAAVVNRLLGALKTSHTAYYMSEEPEYYQLLDIYHASLQKELTRLFPDGQPVYTGIGISTVIIGGKTFIKTVPEGSPAFKAGLRPGDRILSVDGKPFQPIHSFASRAGQPVTIEIQPTPDLGSRKRVTVVPEDIHPARFFLDAMKASARVLEQNGIKIGYIHVWSYAGEMYQQQLVEEITAGRLKDADGLILDLRDGWGGANPDYLNVFNKQVPVLTMRGRDGVRRQFSRQWRKPVALLVNSGTRSGKEVFAYAFKKHHLGKVIGTTTAGAVVGGQPFLLSDGSLLLLSVLDIAVDGERLEGRGVTPDISVKSRLEYSRGKDPQYERAITLVGEMLRCSP